MQLCFSVFRFLTIAISFLILSFGNVIAATVNCPVKVGSTVKYRDAEVLYNSLADLSINKGEFETTKQYKERKAKLIKSNDLINNYIIIEAYYDGYYGEEFSNAEYDADNQRFLMKIPSSGSFGYSSVFDDFSIVDHSYSVQLKEYELDLTPISRCFLYSVFDRKTKNRDIWIHDTKIGKKTAVYLPVPIQHARALKNTFRVGIVAQSKEPYVKSGAESFPPTRIYHYKVIIADILCAVISDKDGLVLKTISPTNF